MLWNLTYWFITITILPHDYTIMGIVTLKKILQTGGGGSRERVISFHDNQCCQKLLYCCIITPYHVCTVLLKWFLFTRTLSTLTLPWVITPWKTGLSEIMWQSRALKHSPPWYCDMDSFCHQPLNVSRTPAPTKRVLRCQTKRNQKNRQQESKPPQNSSAQYYFLQEAGTLALGLPEAGSGSSWAIS